LLRLIYLLVTLEILDLFSLTQLLHLFLLPSFRLLLADFF